MIAYAALIDDQADLLRFNELVELYQEDMIRIARSVLFDHQLAEDAVQNALYGIAVSFKKVPSHDAKAVRVYMLSSAKHAALRNGGLLRNHRYFPGRQSDLRSDSAKRRLRSASPCDRTVGRDLPGRAPPLLFF